MTQEIIESMEKSSKSQKDIDETVKLIDQHQTKLDELLEIKEKYVFTILIIMVKIIWYCYCRLLEHKLELARTLAAKKCKNDEERQKVTALEEKQDSLAASTASLKVFIDYGP